MMLCISAGNFCGSYAPWNLENIRKSTNNLSFLCQFFINEITTSDAGPDIIRSHLFNRERENKDGIFIVNSLSSFSMWMINRVPDQEVKCSTSSL